MGQLSVSWRDIAGAFLLFALVLLAFSALSVGLGWPSSDGGWRLAVIVAAAAAILPLVGRILNFLQTSRASVQAFGVKLDFAAAVQSSQVSAGTLTIGTIQQGTYVLDSGSKDLDEAAQEAAGRHELIIDLADGAAWYRTRLFALAAMDEVLNGPKYLILIGQKGGRPKQAGGIIASADLVRAFCLKDARYDRVLKHSRDYLDTLMGRRPARPVAKPGFPALGRYQHDVVTIGKAVFMRILVHQLTNPDPAVLDPQETAPETGPPWINLGEMEQELSPWLARDIIEMSAPPKQQVAAILSAHGDIALAARDGTFEGIIQVHRTLRHVVRQLAERVTA